MPQRSSTKNVKVVDDDDDSPKASSSRKRTPRTRVSAACEACKKRKTKCTGEPVPCQLCVLLGTECVIDLTQDMRRRAAMQQTISDSKSNQESLNSLVECIRDGDPDTIQSLREVFRRKNVTKSEISAAIQHWSHLITNRALDVADGKSGPSTSRSSTESRKQPPRGQKTEEQASQWQPDPSLRADSPDEEEEEEEEGGASAIISSLHRYLKECSDDQGERILNDLLYTNNIAEIEKWLPVEDVTSRIDPNSDLIDPELATATVRTEQPKNFWHPALQSGPGSVPFDTPADDTRRTSVVSMSQGIYGFGPGTGESQQYNVSGHMDMSVLFPIEDSTSNKHLSNRPRQYQDSDHDLATLTGSTDGSYHIPPSMPVYVVKPPLSSLLVAKDSPPGHVKLPIHLVQPLLQPDNSHLSRVYTDYLWSARHKIANGGPALEIMGSDGDIVVDTFFRQRQPGDRWDCCSWACEASRGFAEFDIYVRLASVYFLTRLMQWLVFPTAEKYTSVPDMIKPTPSQRMTPHVGAIDLIPIPCIRDAAIDRLRDWLTPLAQARWTVNWPYFQDDAIEYDPSTSSRRLTQRFIDHVSVYDNWSVGAHFFNTFPEVAGKIKLHGQ